jgi:lantibiotic modifying enzyme
VRDQVGEWLAGDRAADARPTVGAFEGLGSVVYLLTHLGVVWRRPELLDEAEQVVDTLPALIASDDHLDVLYGSAGCLLALLALHAVRPSARTVDVAVSCGDRLLETARPMAPGTAWVTLEGQPPLGGLSHGTAGIAVSLLDLAAASGEDRFKDAASAALAYDRSLFIPEVGNWADLRVFPERQAADAGTAGRSPMVAWCHGAAGIGLARLAMLRHLDDRRIRDDIDVALGTTIAHGFAINHSLCHGALGNLELLLLAAHTLDRPGDRQALAQATSIVAGSLDANGPVSGVFLGVETPGFMTGLAGIGYGLLRLAEPDKVPSALLLAPPSWSPPA